jgi:hypothetical protein
MTNQGCDLGGVIHGHTDALHRLLTGAFLDTRRRPRPKSTRTFGIIPASGRLTSTNRDRSASFFHAASDA